MSIMEGSERASGLCSGKNSELKVFYQGEKEEDVTLSVFFLPCLFLYRSRSTFSASCCLCSHLGSGDSIFLFLLVVSLTCRNL